MDLLRSLGSPLGPIRDPNFRRSCQDGIDFYFLIFIFSLAGVLVGIFRFTKATAASGTLHRSSEDDFKEGNNQAEDQPNIDHLHVRGGGQLLNLAGEDGGHHQHDGQVHGNDITKEIFVKEGGGEGDKEQEDGGEVGGQQFG